MNVPSNRDFATEVKRDRLKLLWRFTLGAMVVLGWVVINIGMLRKVDALLPLIPVVVMVFGAIGTRFLLVRDRYNNAAWVYILSAFISLTMILAISDGETLSVWSFFYALLTFVIGLLLPPTNTILFGLASSLCIAFVPALTLGGMSFFGLPQVAAIAMTIVGAVIAMQVTGDLYQIAEWALENYQRERRVAGELFDSRQELERSFIRASALSERLQEANRELDAARAAAEEAKHFRGQFLANMSHELRTPLNAIIGFSETMLKFPVMYDDVKLPPAYEADLQQIFSSGKQLLSLINDILDLAKVDAGKLDIRMEQVELPRVINMALSTAAGLLGGKPIHLKADVPPSLPSVWADEARVRQVLLNLYSNAAKFTERGTITLTVREMDEGVCFALADTGIGISEDNLDVIFEEFKQAGGAGRDPRSGAGLGLAICRQLLTLMGGRIWAESKPGEGSTFFFVLQPYAGQDELALDEPETVERAVVANY